MADADQFSPQDVADAKLTLRLAVEMGLMDTGPAFGIHCENSGPILDAIMLHLQNPQFAWALQIVGSISQVTHGQEKTSEETST